MRPVRSRSRRPTSLRSPAAFEHTPEDAAGILRGFRALYWGMALVFAIATIFRRELVFLAVGWPLLLLWWDRSARRAPTGWTLTVTDDAIAVDAAGDVRRIDRADASFVRFRRRRIRYAAWTELQVVGPAGRPIFTEGIRDDHRQPIAAALRERGWQVET